MLSDLEIAQQAKLKHIGEIAEGLGIGANEITLYGGHRAKISLDVLERLRDAPNAKYIDVTAMTPTPLGEGKTLTTVGLGQALNYIGKKAVSCIRQPSMGPIFGIKGGAAGGGYSQVLPMEEFNLHLTGDIHAVEVAHNLLAAMIDNHLHQGNALGINPFSISWRRVVDVSDRALRDIIVGLGGKVNGIPREAGFDITVASEIMAILALTEGLQDLRARLARIVIGSGMSGRPVTAEDLKAAGAMTVLLKWAIQPTLVQTTENTPAIVHTGPFANIAHGNSSILADRIASKCADYVVTESGFGAEMGFEKFANIKCRASGMQPDAVVLVATIRSLKVHSGRFAVKPGKPLDEGLKQENLEAVREGAVNLVKQIENVRAFGCEVVVCVNRFPTDTDAEVELVRDIALEAGAYAAAISEMHAKGGEGGADLAEKVASAAEAGNTNFKLLYPDAAGIKDKIAVIASKLYGAGDVSYTPEAEKQIESLTGQGFASLPLCMAKTPLSLSHDPARKGRPEGFTLPIREVKASVGAGFLIPYCGNISLMPGLPSVPSATKIDIDENGNTIGLF